MSDEILLGIDCGDAELRAAYIRNNKVTTVPLPTERSTPIIFYDAYANISSIGVGFPSILGSVGTTRRFNFEKREETSDSIVTKRLTAVRQTVHDLAGTSPHGTVVAVPATFSEHRRRALVACAQEAGLENVKLVDKCTAAAIGFHRNAQQSQTILAFYMGYGDCEYSVARLARGRCRVVASASAPEVSGEMLDALMLETIVLALRKEHIFLGLKEMTAAQWLGFRHIAEVSRNQVDRQSTITVNLDPQITRQDKAIQIDVNSAEYTEKSRPLIEKSIDGVHGILEQGQLDLQDVDEFLVVGTGGTNGYVFNRLKDSFDGRPTLADPDLVAIGAAYYAAQMSGDAARPGRKTVSSNDVEAGESLQKSTQETTEGQRKLATTDQSLQEAGTTSTSPSEPSLAVARRLIFEGRYDDAAATIEQILDEAESLKRQVEEAQPPPGNLWLQQAEQLLDQGRYQEAVGMSHRAYDDAPDDPSVFAGMMRIHAEAALKMNRPEDYQAAIRVLACAHGHDQTDRSVHQAMAERHFIHAMAMRNLNNIGRANEAVNTALSFNPKHEGANQLLEELTAHQASIESKEP